MRPNDATGGSSSLTFYRWLWVFPVIYAVHVAEEAPGFSRWVRHTLGGELPLSAFFINNAAFMAVLIALCVLATRVKRPWAVALLFFWVAGQQFWNFVFHLYTQILFGDYSPGVITAVFLYYPTFLFLAARAVREKHVSLPVLAGALIAGLPGMFMAIWAGLYQCGPMPAMWLPEALR